MYFRQWELITSELEPYSLVRLCYYELILSITYISRILADILLPTISDIFIRVTYSPDYLRVGAASPDSPMLSQDKPESSKSTNIGPVDSLSYSDSFVSRKASALFKMSVG